MTVLGPVRQFRENVAKLPREEILALIKDQDPELIKGINRIEWVFRNKLTHLTWQNGDPVLERDLTNEELALILDPPFMVDPELSRIGMTEEQQYELFVASDPVLWAKTYVNANPRVYQILMMRDESLRKLLRCGRRAGKTWTLAILLLHFCYVNEGVNCLVMAPMKNQVALIHKEVNKLCEDSIVKESIERSVTTPQHLIEFRNGSQILMLTTGVRSAGKSDGARGQEANLIVLDEMDYMGEDDLDAIYVMLMDTQEGKPPKKLIAASTPTGRREKFYHWSRSDRFQEFWFPSYVIPTFSKAMEEEFHEEYDEMGYRHEVEADWGEDVEGVYPRKYIDRAFKEDWTYHEGRMSARSTYLMGVDWDKYGAGPNIVVLEYCHENYEDERFQGKIRVAFREEIPRSEYVLTEAVDRVIELNNKFQPEFIAVDRGAGEVQVELLHKHGMDHPHTNLKKRVKGISFSSSVEVRDPATREKVKKDTKVFMVESLRALLERGGIMFPSFDEELYLQLISYVVVRTTASGRPVFEASGSQADHAHDALILAVLMFVQNFDDLFKQRYATFGKAFSNNLIDSDPDMEEKRRRDSDSDDRDSPSGRTIHTRRSLGGVPRRRSSSRPIVRKSF